ncbi:hypothetical protein B1C78_08905 [Thioalkalivibrio denitrificans]|uniref:Uncharacterized protein n=1 Tax=Thioalkalivibrio denitrificans TaxID=108003 RepID=A0A1V3NHT8_9GAMM|nr:hypothetical protein [Thioalkalivibrio denitrificans]OOG24326.1 hypothetical protein B1C78_08905 [Thioalkalivibrio denitrificans]
MPGTHIDIDGLAAEALAAFPPQGGNREAALHCAQRRLSSLLARGRHAGGPSGADSEQALRERLSRAVENAPAPPKAVTSRGPSPSAPGPVAPLFGEEYLRTLVGAAFAAPMDGGRVRWRVLADRARLRLERAAREAGLGWWARFRLRRKVEVLIREQRDALGYGDRH